VPDGIHCLGREGHTKDAAVNFLGIFNESFMPEPEKKVIEYCFSVIV